METKEIEIFRLSEIIARSMREELSDDERRVLDEWLAQDERHRTMYAAFGREEVLAEQVRLRQTIQQLTATPRLPDVYVETEILASP